MEMHDSSLSGLLSGLTEPQQQAVLHDTGALLVLAGPGSGKTTVVTRRIARLMEQGTPPWSILALTFTNKAAGEMRERVRVLAGGRDTRGLTVSTFHAFAARQLRLHADRFGVSGEFTIFDAADQKSAVKQAISDAGMESSNWPPASVLAAISRAKQALAAPRDVESDAGDFYARSMARIYTAYQRVLDRSRAMDFDDLLRIVAVALRDDQQLRADLGGRYRFVMVDEYQDTNHAQFIIASALAEAHRNICVVGDPDQSIYAWRGADISNILDFESRYSGATAISLGQNFRSTGHIVAASAALIGHNDSHRSRVLHTALPDGELPLVFGAIEERAEAQEVVGRFKRLHDEDDLPWNEMAVLYRLNALSRVLEEAFRSADIPHVVARGTSFYQRKEIKDALGYLRVLRNPADDISLRRIINTPTRGIGGTTMDRVERFAARQNITLMESLRRCGEIGSLTGRAVAAIGRFVAMIDGWQAGLCGGLLEPTLAELVGRVIEESGLERAMRGRSGEEDLERLANLEELISAAADRDGQAAVEGGGDDDSLPARLAGWLESISLVADADMVDPEQGAVTLMTLHAAKGLEFDVVSIVGCEQGVLPHARASDDQAQLEEERRLCYVGMTRARKHLFLSHAESRTQRGIQERQLSSRFLDELPEASIRRQAPPDPWERSTMTMPDVHPGQPVRHPRFGLGRVVRLGRRPQGATVTVDFVEFGHRTLPAAHASLTPTDDEQACY